MHGRQHEHRMVHRVIGQDGNGPPGGQAQVQQGLRHGAHLAAQLGIGQAAPALCAVAPLGQCQGIRRLFGPALQPFPHAAGIGLQRHGRAQRERTIVKLGAHSARRGNLALVIKKGWVHGGFSGAMEVQTLRRYASGIEIGIRWTEQP